MAWDPDRYLQFADLRTRPGLELIARIPDLEPKQIVDLGSGTGNLTSVIAERWPEAEVAGIDSSPKMVERAAHDHRSVAWQMVSIEDWSPSSPVDLIYSNATLHWLDDHEALFRRLRSYLSVTGVLAVQMPDNWGAPTHVIPQRILDDGSWSEPAAQSMMRDRLSKPDRYRSWTQPSDVEMWRTTYFQTLTGVDPVWTWVTGSVLRPVLAHMGPAERSRFEELCKEGYRRAYPPASNGETTLPFSRLFLVARAR